MSDMLSVPSDILSSEDKTYLYSEIEKEFFSSDTLIYESSYLTDSPLEDIKYEQPLFIQDNQPLVLSNSEFSGPFNFEVDILPNGTKNSWLYSVQLNKVYMNMKTCFPIDFRVKNRTENDDLYIRITPTYSSPQFAQDRVYRCVNHQYTESESRAKYHIIKCKSSLTQYVGTKENNDRLSLLLPLSLPQAGTDSVKEVFEFMCKNSCPEPGMNRRPLEIIFTLEDGSGEIKGRRTLNARICSCPKRDKEKDERDMADKPLPPGKKRKSVEKPCKKNVSVPDEVKETLLTIPVVGKQNIDQILKYCQDLMSGEVIRHSDYGGDPTPYKNVLSKISAMIQQRNE